MILDLFKINKKKVIARNSTLLVKKEGTGRVIIDGRLAEDISLPIGTNLVVDSFNMYTNTVIARTFGKTVSLDYDFIMTNVLVGNEKEQVIQAICIVDRAHEIVNVSTISYILLVIIAFILGVNS